MWDVHVDALHQRFGSTRAVSNTCFEVPRGVVVVRVELAPDFPTVAPQLFVGTKPVPVPWSDNALLPDAVEAALSSTEQCIGSLKLTPDEARAVLSAVPRGAPLLDDVASNSVAAAAFVRTLPRSAAIATATQKTLADIDAAADANMVLAPRVDALSTEVRNLQHEVARLRARVSELQHDPRLKSGSAMARFRDRTAELKQSSTTLGDALARDGAPDGDEERAAAQYVSDRAAYHRAELKLRAFNAQSRR